MKRQFAYDWLLHYLGTHRRLVDRDWRNIELAALAADVPVAQVEDARKALLRDKVARLHEGRLILTGEANPRANDNEVRKL